MICPFWGNIVISVVQNISSFRQFKRPHPLSKHVTISWCCRFFHFFKKISSKHPVVFLIDESRELMQWIVRWQASHTYVFWVTFENKTDEFSCLFCNYSYNLSSIWKLKELPITIFLFGYRSGRSAGMTVAVQRICTNITSLLFFNLCCRIARAIFQQVVISPDNYPLFVPKFCTKTPSVR